MSQNDPMQMIEIIQVLKQIQLQLFAIAQALEKLSDK